MNPLVQILLIVPLIILVGVVYLLRIKNRLENHIYRYRSEGIILQTSLTIFHVNKSSGKKRASLGIVLLTNQRIIILDWHEKTAFDCLFVSPAGVVRSASIGRDKKSITILRREGNDEEAAEINVRNPEAWMSELNRLLRQSISE
jgi:hypothetical protein